MKLTIIVPDQTVYIDNKSYSDLNLNDIPVNVRILQWNNDVGHIEYINTAQNDKISELPAWAKSAVTLWDIRQTTPLDEIVENVNTPLTDAQKLILIRIERNTRLATCDWTQLLDAPNTINKEAWAAYRQALRDLPDNITNLDNVFYPIPPSAQ